jgi:hypothetical protein
LASAQPSILLSSLAISAICGHGCYTAMLLACHVASGGDTRAIFTGSECGDRRDHWFIPAPS